jgi:hypothetical protein
MTPVELRQAILVFMQDVSDARATGNPRLYNYMVLLVEKELLNLIPDKPTLADVEAALK